MSGSDVYVAAMGIISPLGKGVLETLASIRTGTRAIASVDLYSSLQGPLPVGRIDDPSLSTDLPRSHALALAAASEALGSEREPPDAIIVGTTTGGITLTEDLLLQNETDPSRYNLHSTGSIAEYLARHYRCRGPVITVSTACSSGSVALKIALEMIRSGQAKRVLAGGVDALCRLTYYGFHSLQLVDPQGSRPFDGNRRGMTVGEGAALLLLTSADTARPHALARLCGGGLSCDAHHATAPHPEGEGALRAMQEALTDAGLSAEAMSYLYLHGTGTIDNDLAESRAVNALYNHGSLPPVSSTKGAHGHSLAAAGALGVVLSVLAIQQGILPANVGFSDPDPDLRLVPVETPRKAVVDRVLCNAFGFGGNNASLVLERPDGGATSSSGPEQRPGEGFFVHGASCLTAAGNMEETFQTLSQGNVVGGIVPAEAVLKPLSERAVRRMKRLPRMVLSLSVSACADIPPERLPRAVYMGTGWGCLSETNDFLKKLFDTKGRFYSPTDFIGSVHNAPAGLVAIHFQAGGANVTTTGGDCTFEQALLSAALLEGTDPFLLVGADEYHETLSPLFDAHSGRTPADGGGAILLSREKAGATSMIRTVFTGYETEEGHALADMASRLGGAGEVGERFGLILAGIPTGLRQKGGSQLASFLKTTRFNGPVVDYRPFLGDFASASSIAAVLAIQCLEQGKTPNLPGGSGASSLDGRGVLVIGFGDHLTALEVMPC